MANPLEPIHIRVVGDIVVDRHFYHSDTGVFEKSELGGAAGLTRLLHEMIKEKERLRKEKEEEEARKAREKKREEARKAKEVVAASKAAPLGAEVTSGAPTASPSPAGASTESAPASLDSTAAAASDSQAPPPPTVALGVIKPRLTDIPLTRNAYAVWSPHGRESKRDKTKVWRAAPMGRGRVEELKGKDKKNRLSRAGGPGAQVLVLDDGGFDFRHEQMRDCWNFPAAGEMQPYWVILKMSSPVAQGDLWSELKEKFADKLICIISADELRRELVQISAEMSWERTLEDLSDALDVKQSLHPLTVCRHLIITFSIDGALWIDGPGEKQPKATLIFDSARAENEWGARRGGRVFGYLSCMAAAVANATAEQLAIWKRDLALGKKGVSKDKNELALAPAIGIGLGAMRDLLDQGHGLATATPDGYPVARLGGVLAREKNDFATAPVGWRRVRASKGPPWMMIMDVPEVPNAPPDAQASVISGRSRQIVVRGQAALRGVAHAKFGQLTTADRSEIETLRGLRRLMQRYADSSDNKPLSIGVFGPPGAGKSFGVKQLGEEVFGDKAWCEFNLSQFNGPRDLVGAFHQVRDKVLEGLTPVVFWDEFDSRDRVWLQYLLAPMQDGRFQDDQLNHRIGKCVFVFAGGTYFTFAAFGPRDDGDKDKFRRDKGTDFRSRLDGYYDVLGPNQSTLPADPENPDEPPSDICHPLRRALFIRSKLAAGQDDRIEIDPDLLNALLGVDCYRYGARSLEKVVMPLKARRPIGWSALPPEEQLAMHVDPKKFNAILKRDTFYHTPEAIEILARSIHANWLSGPKVPELSSFKAAYDNLLPSQKEDNRAAARRMPEVLALIGLGLENQEKAGPPKQLPEPDLDGYIKTHLELLAEAEHDGWMDHRAKTGWRYNKTRDDAKKLHNLMVPYRDLPEPEKDKDRSSVQKYPKMAKAAGLAIVWLPSHTAAKLPKRAGQRSRGKRKKK